MLGYVVHSLITLESKGTGSTELCNFSYYLPSSSINKILEFLEESLLENCKITDSLKIVITDLVSNIQDHGSDIELPIEVSRTHNSMVYTIRISKVPVFM